MASKRSQALTPTTILTGKTISVDAASLGEAESFDAGLLLVNSDIPRGSSSLSASASPQEVLFTDIGTTSYLVFASVYDGDGTIGYSITNKLSDRFSVTVAFAATIDFFILKT